MSEELSQNAVPLLGVALKGPLPGAIADLLSIIGDLRFVARLCDRILTLPPEPEQGSDDELVLSALWEAAVIAYGRSFVTGKGYLQSQAPRTKIPPGIFEDLLDNAERALHDQVFEERNQHIGHRVGLQEQTKVILVLNPPPGEREVLGVAYFTVRLLGQAGELVEVFRGMATRLADRLQAEVHRLEEELKETARQRLDQMYRDAAPMS